MSSSGQTGSSGGWLKRLAHSLAGEPRDLEQLAEVLGEARERGLIEADVLQMLEAVLQVSEIQVRDIMVPRSQMVVINRDDAGREDPARRHRVGPFALPGRGR
jgi:magnesium and cobalt transporter